MSARAATAAALALAALVAVGGGAAEAEAACTRISHEGRPYTICEARVGRDELRIWHADPEGAPYGSFHRIEAALAAEGLRLGFAMNAGMYHEDRRPVGLLVVEGEQRAPIVLRAGPGNFGMLPNGVFCIDGTRFHIRESRSFADRGTECLYASQSGPMLLIDGALHPRFLPDSTSRFVRNGVGVSRDGARAVFVISEAAVTFHEFARLFRDRLDTPDALYFDGNVSRLHISATGRSDWGRAMGPIVGSVVPAGG
jgi:uncharacterized protein YigE (DUF2233 family)